MKAPLKTIMLPRPVSITIVPTCSESVVSLLLHLMSIRRAQTLQVALESQDASLACSVSYKKRAPCRWIAEAGHLLASCLLQAPEDLPSSRTSRRVLVLNLARFAE